MDLGETFNDNNLYTDHCKYIVNEDLFKIMDNLSLDNQECNDFNKVCLNFDFDNEKLETNDSINIEKIDEEINSEMDCEINSEIDSQILHNYDFIENAQNVQKPKVSNEYLNSQLPKHQLPKMNMKFK